MESVLLYGCEMKALKTTDLSCITRTDNAMIRWTCNTSLEQRLSSEFLRRRLDIFSSKEVIQWSRLWYFGHLTRMKNNLQPKQILDFVIPGQQHYKWSKSTLAKERNIILIGMEKKDQTEKLEDDIPSNLEQE